MKINIESGDLFKLDRSKYVYAHCISTDLRWGRGIVLPMMKTFKCGARWRKDVNQTNYKVGDIGVDESDEGTMINLFTKTVFCGKPTYESLEATLYNLRNWMLEHDRKYLAIPKIGCGLDGLNWNIVLNSIKRVFSETEIEIEVRHLYD